MMPVIITKKASPCTVCGYRIGKGEEALYSRETGTVHPECRGGEAIRKNDKPGSCLRCARPLLRGAGRLEYYEQETDGEFRHGYRLYCLGSCENPTG